VRIREEEEEGEEGAWRELEEVEVYKVVMNEYINERVLYDMVWLRIQQKL
jgi:hypothetical protein